MPTKNGIGSTALEPDQLRLSNELALFGGVQIVRHRRDHVHYEVLEQKSFIEATELSKSEIRYNITLSGRTALTAYP